MFFIMFKGCLIAKFIDISWMFHGQQWLIMVTWFDMDETGIIAGILRAVGYSIDIYFWLTNWRTTLCIWLVNMLELGKINILPA